MRRELQGSHFCNFYQGRLKSNSTIELNNEIVFLICNQVGIAFTNDIIK